MKNCAHFKFVKNEAYEQQINAKQKKIERQKEENFSLNKADM